MNKLPRCEYPKADDMILNGILNLPENLKSIDWNKVDKYRSKQFIPKSVKRLSNVKVIEMAKMVARSFAKNEPMQRHLKLPQEVPATILDYTHSDAFGSEEFGEWDATNII